MPGKRPRRRLAPASRARVIARCRSECGDSRSQISTPAAWANWRTGSYRRPAHPAADGGGQQRTVQVPQDGQPGPAGPVGKVGIERRARLRIPVGARCEHSRISAVTSSAVSTSAGYFRSLFGGVTPASS